MVDGNTALLAVIGMPVRHSLSPYIQTFFAQRSSQNCVCLAFEVTADTLPAFVGAARTLPIKGFNVTMPLKERIIPYLDDLDGTAKESGSVNTVVNRDGKLTGYTTDGLGAVRAIRTLTGEISGKNILILGTGGAAKSASLALHGAGAQVTALSRRDLLPELKGAAVRHWSELPALCADAHVIVNGTPLGMEGHEQFSGFSFLDHARRDTVVFDLVYLPRETQLLRQAKKRGLRTLDGLALLVSQAALSFRLFTGAGAEGEAEICGILRGE